MAYMPHIDNLYKTQTILQFKECWALEKLHGTGTKLVWKDGKLTFFSGGEQHERFVKLFDENALTEKLKNVFGISDKEIAIYGEAIGGKQQGMSHTYGPNLMCVAFDICINGCWLDVPKAEKICNDLGIQFVHYVKIPTTLEALDKERDADSVQAVRNSMGPGKMKEGIVCRPLVEMTTNNGSRVICKHKRAEFAEVATPRKVVDPAKMVVLNEANKIADEWITANRLEHVLQQINEPCIEKMSEIIKTMKDDVKREASGEIVYNDEVEKAIGRKTALMYKEYLNNKLKESVKANE